MKKFILSFLLTLLPIIASAAESGTCGENLTWWYYNDDKTLIISGSGKMSNFGFYSSPWYSYRSEILKVELSDGITSIGEGAFKDCSSLTNIKIPNKVKSIGDYAFFGCSSLKSITIPNGVTSLGVSAFYECSSLKSITIPDGVTIIDECTFWGCSNLKSINIPDGVTSIKHGAFYKCKSLNSIIIPDGVTSIEEDTFGNCNNLTSINFGGVTSIGKNAFYNCSSLISINIPYLVTSIGESAFYNCKNLISIKIPDGVTNIEASTFYKCSGLTSVTIPYSVKSISSYAFAGCSKLTDVYCEPEEVTAYYSSSGGGLYTDKSAFNDSSPQNITLHVPATAIESYRIIQPWSWFGNKVALKGENIPDFPKCATPNVSLVNGKIAFSCGTEGVEYISEVSVSDTKDYYDNEISVPKKFKVAVYATKANHDTSDTATAEFDFSKDTARSGDVDGNGVVNVADHVKLSEIIMNQNK